MVLFRRGASPGSGDSSLQFDTKLLSSLPGLMFQATLDTAISGGRTDSGDARQLRDAHVREHVTAEATKTTRAHSVTEVARAQNRLLIALAKPAPLPQWDGVTVRLTNAMLVVLPGDVHAAREFDAILREEHLRGERMRHRTAVLREILTHRGLAYAWWLGHQPGPATDSPKPLIDAIVAEIVSAGPPPDHQPDSNDRLVTTLAALLGRLTSAERKLLLDKLVDITTVLGHQDLAQQLTRSNDLSTQ